MSRLALKAIQAASGAAGGDPVYADDVFSTTLYTGNGSSQTVESDVPLGKDNITLFKYNDNSTTLATLTNHEEGDIVVIWDTNSSSGITFTVNSNSTTALHSQYTWVSHGYYQNLHKYTITASDVSAGNINVTASSGTTWGGSVFLIKGATGVSLQSTTTDANGNSVAASSFTTSSYGILLISDRDQDATSPASTNSSIVGSVNSNPNYFSIHAWLMDSGAAATVTGVQGSSNYYQAYAVIEVEGVSNDGGLLWLKERTNARYHYLYDTERGGLKSLSTNATSGQANLDSSKVSALNGTGFSVGNGVETNGNTYDYAAWTFKKQAGFFDVVTWTGNSTSGRTVSHNLGSVPGMIIVKRTDTTGAWQVYHRANTSDPETDYLVLNTTAATNDSLSRWNDTAPTSTEFTLGNSATVNYSGGTYVAYLFAHDDQRFGENSNDAIIKCDSFTTDSSGNGSVDLGFEPQWILIKKTNSTGSWGIMDSMRGFTFNDTNKFLFAQSSDAETDNSLWDIRNNGFALHTGGASNTFVYVAIRRPHKPASEFAATDLFAVDTRGGTAPTPPNYTSGFPVDMELHRDVSGNGNWRNSARLIQGKYLEPNSTAAQGTDANMTAFDYQNGFRNSTTTGSSKYAWMFRRAPGFFDVVAYTGQSAEMSVSHNLGVTPELIIQKCRTQGSGYNWNSWYTGLTNSQYINLNTTAAPASSSNLWGTNSTVATDSVFRVGSATTGVNGGSSNTHIAYLFATAEGISKVGTYTGSGSTQTIDCGFSNGARFVLIKSVSGSSNWFLWDYKRGITSGLDNYIIVNQNAAQTTNSPVDVNPASSGFEVFGNDSDSNRSGETYLFLAIA